MKIVKLNCTACGAPISIPENIDQLNCSACGTFLQVDRGEGYVALRVFEKLAKALELTGKETTDAIKESSFVTKNELQKLQLQQEIISNQTKLANIEAEIRGLKRSSVNKIASNELNLLYKKQYDLLDRLRLLEKKYHSPLPEDIEGLIFTTENEISYIDQMISVLFSSYTSNKTDLIKSLQNMRYDQSDYLAKLKARQIRNKFPIFQQNFNEIHETHQAVKYLASLAEAEKSILSLPDSPEKNLVIIEINYLKDKLSKDWAALERARVSNTLHGIPLTTESEDLEGLIATRELLFDNIRKLQNENQNLVVKDLLKEQQAIKEKLQKRINKIDKKIRKEQAKRAQVISKGQGKSGESTLNQLGQGALFASVGVFIGGLWLAVKSTFSSEKNESNLESEGSRVVQRDNIMKDQNPPDLKSESPEKTTSKSINKGIIYFILILISFSCVGVFSIMMFEVIFSIETSNATGATVLLVFLIALLVAQKMFINQAFGSVYIKGMLFLPNLYLSRNHPGHGIKNSVIVKILVGVFVFISFGLFAFTIAAYVPYNDEGSVTGLAVFLLSIGMILDPIISIIAGFRTKVLGVDSLE